MGKRLAKKALLIGWDAADWKIINPLLDAGLMPALERLVNKGVIGNIATMDPAVSPILWTTIATGKRPYKHGILGFIEPDDSEKGVRPVLSTSRKARAVWDILGNHGLKTHVIGWWPSHPAEKVNGICVSNFYQFANGPVDKEWPLAPGAIYPPEKEELFKSLRVHPGEITAAHILPFIPNAASIDPKENKVLSVLSKLLADCSSVHAAATYILENEEWDFMGVYYNALDLFCHNFMAFHPPRREHVQEKYFELYKDVIAGAYRFFDMMLERLVELAGDNITIILISDHGFHPDHLRLEKLPNEPLAPVHEHGQYGVICMSGPGIRKDEMIYGASLMDITPTLLTLFGLPVGEDMDGKVLTAAFDENVNPEKIKSWEIKGTDYHTLPSYTSTKENEGLIKQLADLGYIEAPGENSEKNRNESLTEQRFLLARSYIDAGLYNEAIPVLVELNKSEELQPRFSIYLIRSLLKTGRISECRAALDTLRSGLTTGYYASLEIMEGMLLLDESKPQKALKIFHDIQKKGENVQGLNYLTGKAYLAMQRWGKAQQAFEHELTLNYEHAVSHQGLGLVYLNQKKYDMATDSLLTAIGFNFNMPYAHYQLAMALYYMGNYTKAAEAFEMSLKLAPDINKAREMLVKIYSEHLNDPEKALKYKIQVAEHFKGAITIVSGLPRSGTSMMMQMLKAGGANIFADDHRQPDENNPLGYFEHEAVKRLARDATWLDEAKGKAVKVISYLLPYLPSKFHYKIIFMERELNEVLRSQHFMLVSMGKTKEGDVPLKLLNEFKANLEKIEKWKKDRQNIDVLYIPYTKAIEDPYLVAGQVNSFLGGNLDLKAMASVVNKNLHHQKSGTITEKY